VDVSLRFMLLPVTNVRADELQVTVTFPPSASDMVSV
jgi:hypothetical protein